MALENSPTMKDTSAILSGEAGLEGVRWALQSRTARALLRRELRQMLPPGCAVGSFTLTRAKFKPGKHLLAYYTFPVGEMNDGAARAVPLAVEWREPGSLPAPDPRAQEMEAEANQSGLLEPFLTLQRDLPEWGLRLRVWPLDPEFSQLVRISNPAYAPRLFRSAGIESELCNPERVDVVPLRYRPGERHVLMYLVKPWGGGRLPVRLYAKLYENGADAARAERIANRVVTWLEGRVPGFSGVRPAGWSETDAVILYPHAEGIPLSRQLGRSPRWLAGQLRLVGAALASLHLAPESLVEDLVPNPYDKEVKVIARASQQVQALLPGVGQRVLRLLERAGELHARQPQEPPTFTHSDFKSDHLLAGSAGITLIDFDTCALADPALDVGKFLADLDWWHALTGQGDWPTARQAFLEGYGSQDVPGRLARAQIYHALILTKITLRRAKLFSNDWAELTERMIGRAEKVLGTVEG